LDLDNETIVSRETAKSQGARDSEDEGSKLHPVLFN